MLRTVATYLLGGFLRLFFHFRLSKKSGREVFTVSPRRWIPFGRSWMLRSLQRVQDETTLLQWRRNRKLVHIKVVD